MLAILDHYFQDLKKYNFSFGWDSEEYVQQETLKIYYDLWVGERRKREKFIFLYYNL